METSISGPLPSVKSVNKSVSIVDFEKKKWERFIGKIDQRPRRIGESHEYQARLDKLPQIATQSLNHSINYSLQKDFSLNSLGYDQKAYQSQISQALEKFAQTSDPTDIVGKGKSYYPRVLDEQTNVNPERELSQQLLSLRKEYDKSKEVYLKQQARINQMRQDTDQIKKKIEESVEKDLFYDQTIRDMTIDKQLQQQQLVYVQIEKQVFKHMLDRMKNDLLIIKKQAIQSQNVLDLSRDYLKSISFKESKLKQKENVTQLAFSSILQTIEEEQQGREFNLKMLKTDIDKQTQVEEQRQFQIQRQQMVAQRASHQLSQANTKQWKQLYHVHYFLSSFLKSKMEREMNKFKSVEKAFQKIKASTGVSDAGEIVYKFLNRQNTYGQLLTSIADYEKKITELKQRSQLLEGEINRMKSQTLNSQINMETIQSQLNDSESRLAATQAKSKETQLVQQRVWLWMLKNQRKLDQVVGNDQPFSQYQQQFPGYDDIPKVFANIIKQVQEIVLSLNQEEYKTVYDEQFRQTEFDDDYHKRNVRVRMQKSMSNSRSISQDSKNRLSAREDSIYEDFFSQTDKEQTDEEKQRLQQEEKTFIKEEQERVKQKL